MQIPERVGASIQYLDVLASQSHTWQRSTQAIPGGVSSVQDQLDITVAPLQLDMVPGKIIQSVSKIVWF